VKPLKILIFLLFRQQELKLFGETFKKSCVFIISPIRIKIFWRPWPLAKPEKICIFNSFDIDFFNYSYFFKYLKKILENFLLIIIKSS